jgi:predicted MFS family arabinose efflux permease
VNTTTEAPPLELSRPLLWVLTAASGICVANLYYCQPLLQLIQDAVGASPSRIGLVPTATQVGYAVGIFFIIPLGDMRERKRLIVAFTAMAALSLFFMACARSLAVAVGASFLIGLATMTPHLIIPLAAHLAPENKRGETVGTVISGFLFGILLARTVAGFIGTWFGWRAMFTIAGSGLLIVAGLLAKALPRTTPTFRGRYGELLRSIARILIEQPVLQEGAIFGATLFGAFSAFWATLVYLLESPAYHIHLAAMTAGLFGVLGAGGAVVAPLVGRATDRLDPRKGTGIGILMTAAAFAIYLARGAGSLFWLGVGVFVMDVGVQSAQITNQARIFAILPEARSRINTAYMFSYFCGGATGSWLGTLAWARYGWTGVCSVGFGFCAIAGLVYGFGPARRTSDALALR